MMAFAHLWQISAVGGREARLSGALVSDGSGHLVDVDSDSTRPWVSARQDGRRGMAISWAWGSKIFDELLLEEVFGASVTFRGRVLDLGCGRKPYQRIAGPRVERWFGLDMPTPPAGPPAADVFGSALASPFRANSFDTVLCTQTLEHVVNPFDLLREAARVLKPGGALVLTAPQVNPLHEEPHDYFRFTCHGLRLLAEQAGLDVLSIRPVGGAIATVGQMVLWHSSFLRRLPLVGSPVTTFLTVSLAWVILKLDWLSFAYGGGARKDTLGWVLIARKPLTITVAVPPACA